MNIIEYYSISDSYDDGSLPDPLKLNYSTKEKAIEAAINKGTKFIIVQAPTGSGKSFISKTLSNITNECENEYRNLVFNYHAFDEDYEGAMQKFKPHGLFALTTTKALQNQYKALFNESSVFKGKSNYMCNVDQHSDVEIAPCMMLSKMKEDCWKKNFCSYYNARNEALTSQFTALNYKIFFTVPDHLKRKNYIEYTFYYWWW